MWEDIHARAKANGFRIRSIWIADLAWEGASGVLNEQVLGNDRMWVFLVDLLIFVLSLRIQVQSP